MPHTATWRTWRHPATVTTESDDVVRGRAITLSYFSVPCNILSIILRLLRELTNNTGRALLNSSTISNKSGTYMIAISSFEDYPFQALCYYHAGCTRVSGLVGKNPTQVVYHCNVIRLSIYSCFRKLLSSAQEHHSLRDLLVSTTDTGLHVPSLHFVSP